MASPAVTLREKRHCIHCLAEKETTEFNGDHVVQKGFLPAGFGATSQGWVLDCVCQACNQHFGDGDELKFLRDSLEGYDRYFHGVRDPAEYKSLGKRSTTSFEFGEDSPEPGAKGYFVPPKSGTVLSVTIGAEVGFGQSENGPFTWYPVDAAKLPPGDELKALGRHMRTRGEADLDQVAKVLATRGLGFVVIKQTDPPKGLVEGEVVFHLARPEFRAITKIALNYVARVFGTTVALDSSLDTARRFARYDVGRNPVAVGRGRTRTHPVHYVSAQTHEGRLVAHVSLFMRVRYYEVELANPFLGERVSSACIFRPS